MKSVVEKVDEIELVVVLKSLHAGKYFEKKIEEYAPSPRMGNLGSCMSNCSFCFKNYKNI